MSRRPLVVRGPVVAGVDGSAGALRAVEAAALEASSRGVALHLVHVARARLGVPRPGRHPAVRPLEEALAAVLSVAPGLVVRVVPRTGPPAAALLDAAREADLIVVGSRGHGPVAAALFGSVALEVAARTTCPLLVVRDRHRAARDAPVVVGVEGSSRDLPALEFAFEEALLHRVPVLAVHGWGALLAPLATAVLPRLVADDAALAEAAVREILEPFRERFPDVPVQVRAVTDHADALLARASSDGRLLVVGTRGRAVLPALLLGSVTLHALHESRCPVVVVPGGPGDVGTDRDVRPSPERASRPDDGCTATPAPEARTS